ncbi:MAG: hypothetical protein NTU92_02040 [Methylotenera sp.]|nr:hypothetical protein [Methylotenera sp.]
MTEKTLFDKFHLRPTAKLRLAATTFLIENELFADVSISRRVASRKVAERLTKVIFLEQGVNRRKFQEIQFSRKSQTSFDYRTWDKWRSGNVKSEPTYLSSVCKSISKKKHLDRFIDGTYMDNSINLHFYALDVFASKFSNAKVNAANNILRKLEVVWTVDKGISQIKIHDNWLSRLDKNKPLKLKKPPKTIEDMLDYDYYCEKTKLHCFSVESDVSKRHEVDAPFLLLPYLLRNILYLGKSKTLPINTFAIDLATATLATNVIMNSRVDKSNFIGPKRETLDAAQSIFFGLGIDHPRHLISSRAPWERDEYDNTGVVKNIIQVKRAYRNVLHDIGIFSRDIRKVYKGFASSSI